MDFDSAKIILEKLVDGKHATCATLASTLSLSESSVNRCIRALRKSGFPIAYSRKEKTFFLSEEYLGTKSKNEVFERIALDLSRILLGEGSLADAISRIEKHLSMEVSTYTSQAVIVNTKDINIRNINLFQDLDHAISHRKTIMFLYGPILNKYFIEPIYIFVYKDIWYLRGYSTHDWVFMNFDLKNISSLKITKSIFLPRVKDITDDLQSATDLIESPVTQ